MKQKKIKDSFSLFESVLNENLHLKKISKIGNLSPNDYRSWLGSA